MAYWAKSGCNREASLTNCVVFMAISKLSITCRGVGMGVFPFFTFNHTFTYTTGGIVGQRSAVIWDLAN